MSDISGLISITSTAAQQGPSTPSGNTFLLRVAPASTATVWVAGTSGAASSSGGWPLTSTPLKAQVRTLDALWLQGTSGVDVYYFVQN